MSRIVKIGMRISPIIKKHREDAANGGEEKRNSFIDGEHDRHSYQCIDGRELNKNAGLPYPEEFEKERLKIYMPRPYEKIKVLVNFLAPGNTPCRVPIAAPVMVMKTYKSALGEK